MKGIKLNQLLENASDWAFNNIGLNIKSSELNFYSPENWDAFCELNNFDVNAQGIYIPVNFQAYVRTNTPTLISNIFHEYYGHGLFCENINHQFNNSNFSINPLIYEGFASWVEKKMCQGLGLAKVWELKKQNIQPFYLQSLRFFEGIEHSFGRSEMLRILNLNKEI